jgi:hypothetical protein
MANEKAVLHSNRESKQEGVNPRGRAEEKEKEGVYTGILLGMATVPVWHGKRSPSPSAGYRHRTVRDPRETHTDTATDTGDTRVSRLRLAGTAVHTAIEFGLGCGLIFSTNTFGRYRVSLC